MTPIWFPSPPQRILIIKPSAIGDVVHGLPILKLLAKRWPRAQISWMATPACANLLDGHPLLTEVIRFDRKKLGQGWWNPLALWALRRFIRDLRRRQFDLVVDLQGLFRSGYLAWRSGAPYRVGFKNARELAWVFYTHRIGVGGPEQHAIERYLKIAEKLGCDMSLPVEFPFATTDDDRAYAAALLQEVLPAGQRFVVLMPGANWMTKRWPAEHFAALVEGIRRQFALECVVVGAPDDRALGEKIGCVNLAGRTTLRQLTALLEHAELVVANDTGPMHIASALGRPLITLFGPTNPVRTGPYGRADTVIRVPMPCSPCYSRRCSHCRCMTTLSAESVLAKASELLGSSPGSHSP